VSLEQEMALLKKQFNEGLHRGEKVCFQSVLSLNQFPPVIKKKKVYFYFF
jgi:hypothetical protein